MCEFLNVFVACAIIILVMILVVEFMIILRKREIEEWEAEYEQYALENQERYQRINEIQGFN